VGVNYTGTTLYAGEATNSVNSADGYASGTLTGTTIAEDGSVIAQYSNGQKQAIAQLALATFPTRTA
jgi:flagellar hook protein FlgE